MDSKSDKLKLASKIAPIITEEFMIGLSNRGVYKRSLKDFEKLKDSIEIDIDTNKFILKIDEFNVTINEKIGESRCECSSEGICKHILISLIAIKNFYDENKGDISEDNSIQEEEIYKELKEFSSEDLEKLMTKRKYTALLKSLSISQDMNFIENENGIYGTIDVKGISIFFPKLQSITNSVCSCKAKGICEHKIYALGCYLYKEGKLKLEELQTEDKVTLNDENIRSLDLYKEFVSEIFHKGINCFNENMIKQCEKFYVQSYSQNYIKISDGFKALAGQLRLYIGKNVNFSYKRVLHLLCFIYNSCEALQNIKDNEKLTQIIGKKRDEKFNLTQITVYNIGLKVSKTVRDDIYLVGYFYCEELKKILSMGILRPASSMDYFLIQSINTIWSDEYPYTQLNFKKIKLVDAKISDSKLSSSLETKGKIIRSIDEDILKTDLQDIYLDDFSMIKDKIKSTIKFRYFETNYNNTAIFLLKFNSVIDCEFDLGEQKFYFTIDDKYNNTLEFSIKSNSINKSIIKYLENEVEKENENNYILAEIRFDKGDIYPIFLSYIKNNRVII